MSDCVKGSQMPPAAIFQIGNSWAWFVRSDMTGRDEDDITYPFSSKGDAASDFMIFVSESVDAELLPLVMAAVDEKTRGSHE